MVTIPRLGIVSLNCKQLLLISRVSVAPSDKSGTTDLGRVGWLWPLTQFFQFQKFHRISKISKPKCFSDHSEQL